MNATMITSVRLDAICARPLSRDTTRIDGLLMGLPAGGEVTFEALARCIVIGAKP
jgi:hypothetical protein